MFRIMSTRTAVPNVHFKHGDIAELKIYTDDKLLFTLELRAKDLNSDSKLPADGRQILYLKDDFLTVDRRAWPTTKAQYGIITWQLVRLTGDIHTPKYNAHQIEIYPNEEHF